MVFVKDKTKFVIFECLLFCKTNHKLFSSQPILGFLEDFFFYFLFYNLSKIYFQLILFKYKRKDNDLIM
jgi:hypothetical protein